MQITHNAQDQGVFYVHRLHLEVTSINVIDGRDELKDLFIIVARFVANEDQMDTNNMKAQTNNTNEQ